MPASTYTKTGNKASTAAKLSKAVFEVEVKSHELLKQAYVTQRTNSRANNAVTKLRGEVRGGGRKPWRQKGTGRARAGSIRSPLWRGGGITFGPTGNENFSKKLNKKSKQIALRQALSLKNQKDAIKVVESLETKGKTKQVAELLKKIDANGRVLIVVESLTDEITRSTRNIANAKTITGDYLNVVDVIDADVVVIDKKSLEAIEARLG